MKKLKIFFLLIKKMKNMKNCDNKYMIKLILNVMTYY